MGDPVAETQRNDSDIFEGWAILELMGHRRLAGRVKEETIAGTSFLRLDVYKQAAEGEEDHVATQFYSGSAIYCITPAAEEICRMMGEKTRPAPVQRYELEPPRPQHWSSEAPPSGPVDLGEDEGPEGEDGIPI